jgi:plastocyanin
MGLTVPGSIGDFAPAAMMAAGTLLALGGGIAAIRAQAKHHMEDAPSERRIITVALAVVALAMGISAVLSFTGRSTVDAAAAEGAARANMSNFEFAESTYEVAAGGGSILVHNGDAFVHDFAVPALGIEAQTVMPGSEALIEISGAEAGEYRIFCTLHSDQNAATVEDAGMAATLLVK